MSFLEALGGIGLAYKFAIVLGLLIVLSFGAGLVKVMVNRTRLSRNVKIANVEAAEEVIRRETVTNRQLNMGEGDLFGVRAIESGYFGGVAQSRPGTPSASSMLSGSLEATDLTARLKMINQNERTSTTGTVESVAMPPLAHPAPIAGRGLPLRLQPSDAELNGRLNHGFGILGDSVLLSTSPEPMDLHHAPESSKSGSISTVDTTVDRPSTSAGTSMTSKSSLPDFKFPPASDLNKGKQSEGAVEGVAGGAAGAAGAAVNEDASTTTGTASATPEAIPANQEKMARKFPFFSITTKSSKSSRSHEDDTPVSPKNSRNERGIYVPSNPTTSTESDIFPCPGIINIPIEPILPSLVTPSPLPDIGSVYTNAHQAGDGATPSVPRKSSKRVSRSLARATDSLRRHARNGRSTDSSASDHSRERDRMHYDPTSSHTKNGSIQGRSVDFDNPRASPFALSDSEIPTRENSTGSSVSTLSSMSSVSDSDSGRKSKGKGVDRSHLSIRTPPVPQHYRISMPIDPPQKVVLLEQRPRTGSADSIQSIESTVEVFEANGQRAVVVSYEWCPGGSAGAPSELAERRLIKRSETERQPMAKLSEQEKKQMRERRDRERGRSNSMGKMLVIPASIAEVRTPRSAGFEEVVA